MDGRVDGFLPHTIAYPIALPNVFDDCEKYQKNMLASGWGTNGHRGMKRKQLWSVKQQCVDTKKCTDTNDSRPFNKRVMFCIGDLKTTANSVCDTDSGGNFDPNP